MDDIQVALRDWIELAGKDRNTMLPRFCHICYCTRSAAGEHPVQDIYRGQFLRPNGPAFFSPGQRPGSSMSNASSPNGATQSSRPRRYVSPLQGCRLFQIQVPRALPCAEKCRPVGAGDYPRNLSCTREHRPLVCCDDRARPIASARAPTGFH